METAQETVLMKGSPAADTATDAVPAELLTQARDIGRRLVAG